MNLFKLVASLGLDTSEYERKSGEAVESGHHLAGKLGSALATSAKVVAAGVTAAATGITALTTMAVNEYANYEQLVGGVETLFGTGGQGLYSYAKSVGKTVEEASAEYGRLQYAQQTVLDNAAKAYQTAGLSANEYMETVTSFSASLIQSLGGDTAAAARYADMAIIDMSDNANKMGSDMQSIQNAYQGFAKQNYTMLDNLKLGYGGTKEEMGRLLRDAERLDGLAEGTFDISQFGDIVQAIHIIQDQMGVTGTTAHEAATTIQGSLSMAKASFKNLATGIADENADIDSLMDDFIESVGLAADNLIPRIEQTLEGIVELLDQLMPLIIDKIPELASKLLPKLLRAAGNLLGALARALPGLMQVVADTAPGLLLQMADALIQGLPLLLDAAQTILDGLAAMLSDEETMHSLLDSAVEIIIQIGTFLIDNVPLLIDTAINILVALADYLTDPENLEHLGVAAVDMLIKLATALLDGAWRLVETGASLVGDLIDSLLSGDFFEAGETIIRRLIDGMKNYWANHRDEIVDSVLNIFGGGGDASGFRAFADAKWRQQNGYGHPLMGSHATGLDYVPYNGYIAELHRGERVLTREESEKYGRSGSPVTIGSVEININGGDFGDREELAEYLADALQTMTDRKEAVYA